MSDSNAILGTIETVHQKISHVRTILNGLSAFELSEEDAARVRDSISCLDDLEDKLAPVARSYSTPEVF